MMKTQLYFLLGVLLLTISCSQQVSIVPEPVKLEQLSGKYTLDSNTEMIFLNIAEEDNFISYAKDFTNKYFDISLNVTVEQQSNWDALKEKNAIIFKHNTLPDEILGNEGYRITVSDKGIFIEANTSAGFIYSLQTLLQLAPADITQVHSSKITIPAVSIVDYPRFEWRGSHLDVSRHFFDINYVKKHLDIMAFYKLNKFHWHLTDDHGWRIEIEKYPKLTEIGALRVDRSDVRWLEGEPPKDCEKAIYGGFYTKDQIREIIEYAAQRNIEVVPEIEIPGHCSEVLAAYPELACDKFPYYVQIGPYWPPKAILCGGNDNVMQFLKDVLDEVAELFPSQYIHIGGDEALKDNWLACSKCQQRIKKLELPSEEALQGWMICEVEQHLQKHGKKIIGWDEILDGGVTADAIIMYWRSWVGDSVIINAARHGNDIIMTPNDYCYFDYYQADKENEPEAIGGYISLEHVYAFDPVLPGIPEDLTRHIKGGQANLWSEFIFTSEQVEYMLLPRLLAMSESVWSTKENKNWNHFVKKLPVQKQRLAALGYNYCDKIGLIKPVEVESEE